MYCQEKITESPVSFNSVDTFIKQKIISLTNKVLETKNVEEIISDYELGNLPEFDNVQLQMALIALTEEKLLGKVITKADTYEMPKNGRFLRDST